MYSSWTGTIIIDLLTYTQRFQSKSEIHDPKCYKKPKPAIRALYPKELTNKNCYLMSHWIVSNWSPISSSHLRCLEYLSSLIRMTRQESLCSTSVLSVTWTWATSTMVTAHVSSQESEPWIRIRCQAKLRNQSQGSGPGYLPQNKSGELRTKKPCHNREQMIWIATDLLLGLRAGLMTLLTNWMA